jgi:hypothetical protein
MKKIKLLLILIIGIFFQETIAQKQDSLQKEMGSQKKRISHRDRRIYRTNPNPSEDDCVFTKQFNVNQRLKRYPFYKAKRIIAVSYLPLATNIESLITDTIKIPDTVYKVGLHIKNGKLNRSSIIEIKELNSSEIDTLTNIIYNTKVRKPSNYVTTGHNCYIPRNALIFYDKDGKIFDHLEVCFKCLQYDSQSHKITVGSYCNQKFDLLKSIFIDIGIKYGTD